MVKIFQKELPADCEKAIRELIWMMTELKISLMFGRKCNMSAICMKKSKIVTS